MMSLMILLNICRNLLKTYSMTLINLMKITLNYLGSTSFLIIFGGRTTEIGEHVRAVHEGGFDHCDVCRMDF